MPLLALLMMLASGPKAPVLVELFTSEGCSSCPPADVLLETLDRTQPVEGAEIIVLSEHVDYWNQIGWTDPYSSAQFSQRQQTYAKRLRLEGPYTPQMVVDGAVEFVGSDRKVALAAIGKAAQTQKVPIHISTIGQSRVKVEVEGAPNADVYVALARNEAVSKVVRGENSGRTLHHIAVVQKLTQAGKTNAAGTLSKEIDLPPNAAKYRVVAFVQEPGQGRILGSAILRLAATD